MVRRFSFLVGLALMGCSSKDSPNVIGFPDVAPDDTRRDGDGAATDTGVDAPDAAKDATTLDTAGDSDATTTDTTVDDTLADVGSDDEAAVDTTPEAPPPDGSTAIVPVGKLCSTDGECDPTGAAVGVCSNNLYAPDTTDPDPVCVARRCTLGAPGTALRCGEADVGVCVPGGGDNQCFPACTFDAAGSTAAVGCKGNDACNYFGVQTGSTGTVTGVGFCSGGCTADAQCKSGNVCQREDGICVATRTTYAKVLGDTCTGADGECPCVLNASTLTGFCTRFCLTASSIVSCPSGFTCDPGVPAKDSGGATLFTGIAPGLVGSCFKNCTTDGDCTALSGYCADGAATGQRVCRAGPKP